MPAGPAFDIEQVGTSIPVSVVLDNLAARLDPRDVLTIYPNLSEDDVRACIAWAAEISHGKNGVIDADFEESPEPGAATEQPAAAEGNALGRAIVANILSTGERAPRGVPARRVNSASPICGRPRIVRCDARTGTSRITFASDWLERRPLMNSLMRMFSAAVVVAAGSVVILPGCGADPQESAVDEPAVEIETPSLETQGWNPCNHCLVRCWKGGDDWGNWYDRGYHNDCAGTAAAFCWDKWGYTGSQSWCPFG